MKKKPEPKVCQHKHTITGTSGSIAGLTMCIDCKAVVA